MSLIVGLDDFGEAVHSQLDFIDKSLFIKEIFDRKAINVSVIIRPRRFGKTFNLSMLHHFLAPEVNGLKTAEMFSGLKIAQAGGDYMKEQGKHPVITVSFKSIKFSGYTQARESFAKLMSQVYTQYYPILMEANLYPHEKNTLDRILNEQSTDADLMDSLTNLSAYLYRYYKVKPWLLIDEYDTPIQAAHLYGYYEPMINLMRGLFGSALKGNSNIHRAVITGILRIAKENLFSGVNNLDVFSILSPEYAQHFGFTQEEVDTVLSKHGLPHLSDEIKKWYNGYHIGDYQIYNPWSISNCISKAGAIKPYWVNTSDNLLIKQTLARAEVKVKEEFETILAGKPIEATVNESTVFADLDGDSESVWGLLLFSGYLTAIQSRRIGIKNQCLLIPPNQEVSWLYPDIIRSWFLEELGEENYDWLLKSLTEGDLDTFLVILQKFLRESISYFDVSGAEPEKFYHGLVLGLIISLSKTHEVHSNKESGFGRYDVVLIPKDLEKLGIILEFKVVKGNKTLPETAEEALAQINARHYEVELQQRGIRRILKIGLGFRGKEVSLASH